jgi:hypothetical protein
VVRAFAPFARDTYGFFVVDTGQQTVQADPPFLSEVLPTSKFASRSTPLGHCLVLRLYDVAEGLLDRATVDRVAFTLAVTLQDLMEALFPGIGHRVAVLSPQAEAVYKELFKAESGTLDYVIARRWPHLIEGFSNIRPRGATASQVVAWLDNFASTEALPETSALDFILLEDWLWDLGVIGAVQNKLNKVMQAWSEYLNWNVENESTPDLYYRMGTSQLHGAFAFTAASRLVRRLATPVSTQPEPTKPADS